MPTCIYIYVYVYVYIYICIYVPDTMDPNATKEGSCCGQQIRILGQPLASRVKKREVLQRRSGQLKSSDAGRSSRKREGRGGSHRNRA